MWNICIDQSELSVSSAWRIDDCDGWPIAGCKSHRRDLIRYQLCSQFGVHVPAKKYAEFCCTCEWDSGGKRGRGMFLQARCRLRLWNRSMCLISLACHCNMIAVREKNVSDNRESLTEYCKRYLLVALLEELKKRRTAMWFWVVVGGKKMDSWLLR